MAPPTVAFSHFGIHVIDLARMQDSYTRVLADAARVVGSVKSGAMVRNNFRYKRTLPSAARNTVIQGRGTWRLGLPVIPR